MNDHTFARPLSEHSAQYPKKESHMQMQQTKSSESKSGSDSSSSASQNLSASKTATQYVPKLDLGCLTSKVATPVKVHFPELNNDNHDWIDNREGRTPVLKQKTAKLAKAKLYNYGSMRNLLHQKTLMQLRKNTKLLLWQSTKDLK